MWNKPGPPVAIDPSQLTVGLYVWLDVRWDEHPFLTNRFLIKTPQDLATLQSLDLQGRLYHHPDKSTCAPLPLAAAPPTAAQVSAAEQAQREAMAADIQRAEQHKREVRQRQKDAAARADRAWENAARHTKEALLTLSRSPKAAGELIANLSRETASAIARGQDVLLHLLGDKKDQGPQFHALNVLTLCMLMGKKAGLSEQELTDLAMAALTHDAGKALIPPPILKNRARKKHEEDLFRQHVDLGVQLAAQSGAFTKEALGCIADHHEAVDGSGWPRGRRTMPRVARILAIANRYDVLCTPEAQGVEPLMPAKALARMFIVEAKQHDQPLLSLLIKLLGVYPPGTVVKLSDDSLALVVAPGAESLRPQVLVYTPEIPKDDAPTIELGEEPELKIVEAIPPTQLPPDVLAWLNPQQRLSYFFSVEKTAG